MLRSKDAMDWFREQMRRGDESRPGDKDHGIVARGVRFYYVTTVQDRARW